MMNKKSYIIVDIILKYRSYFDGKLLTQKYNNSNAPNDRFKQ